EGVYSVTVTLKHDALAALTSNTQSITIADQQITNLASANLPGNGTEGQTISAVTGIATFTDPAGVGAETTADFTATINWGDGTTSTGTVVSTSGGNYRVDAPAHTYVDEGTYAVTVTVKHDALAAVTSNSQTIAIADQQITTSPDATLPAPGPARSPFTALFRSATFTDPAGVGNETTADFTATINWGDSTTSAGAISSLGGGNYRVDAPAHTYVEEGTYTVTVTVKHDALAPVTSAGQSIAIADQQLTNVSSSNL